MKKLLIISLVVLIAAGIIFFAVIYKAPAAATTGAAAAPIMRVQSPDFLTNANSLEVPDPMFILLPVKSCKVLSKKDNMTATVELKSNLSAEELQKYTRLTDLFKYKDLSKYSILIYSFKNGQQYPYGGYLYLTHFTTKLELEFYPDEVTDMSFYTQFDNANAYLPSWDLNAHLVLKDMYTNKQDTADIPFVDKEIDVTKIDEAYKNINTKYYEDLIKTPEFLAAVKELDPKIKDLDERYKTVEIFNWVTDNIAYDKELSESEEYDLNAERRTAIGALKYRKTVCIGYSYVFNALTRYYGLSDYVIRGKTSPDTKEFHSWNTVALSNGEYLNVDCTQNIVEQYMHDKFEKTHFIWDGKEYVPYRVVDSNTK